MAQAATRQKVIEDDTINQMAQNNAGHGNGGGTNNAQAAQNLVQAQQVIEPCILYLEHMSKETIDVAKSHTSWMNFKDNREFQDIERNPFNFQYVKAISTLEEYRQLAYTDSDRAKPVVVITSMASLSQGFSRQILKQFAARDQNEIVFIERAFTKDSIAGQLFKNIKKFPMQEIKAVKPSSALTSALKPPSAPAPAEAAQAALLKKNSNDPRKNALLKPAAGSVGSAAAEKNARSMMRKTSIDDLVSETMNTKSASGKGSA